MVVAGNAADDVLRGNAADGGDVTSDNICSTACWQCTVLTANAADCRAGLRAQREKHLAA